MVSSVLVTAYYHNEIESLNIDRVIIYFMFTAPGLLILTLGGVAEVVYFFRNWVDDFENVKTPGFYANYYKTIGLVSYSSKDRFAWTSKPRPSKLYTLFLLVLLFTIPEILLYSILIFTPITGGVLLLICFPFYIRSKHRRKKASSITKDYLYDGP